MCKRFGLHSASRHSLNVIVAHSGSRSQRGFHVTPFQQPALLCRMRPNSGQAIGLQLHHYGKSISRLRIALLQLADLALDPGEFLNVMPDLMCNHVSLSEFSWRAEALLQLIVKT